MKLIKMLFFWIQFLFCFTYAEIVTTNLEKGLHGLAYHCDTLNTCENLIKERNYKNLTPVVSFIQHQDSSISYNTIADVVHQLTVENSNFAIENSGFFKPFESGLYGFDIADKGSYSSIEIDDIVHINKDSDYSTFWIHLNADTIYNIRIMTLSNDLSLQTSIFTIKPSGLHENILLSTYYDKHSNEDESSMQQKLVKRDDQNLDVPVDVTFWGEFTTSIGYRKCSTNDYITCSAVPTITTISDIVAKSYYVTCPLPPDVTGVFDIGVYQTTYITGGTSITATSTSYSKFKDVTCVTSSTFLDPAESPVTATCTAIERPFIFGAPVYVTVCQFPEDVSASFLASSRAYRDTTYIYYNTPTFSSFTTTVSISNPIETGEATCFLQLSTFSNGQTTSIPTTTCEKPTNLPGEIIASTSTFTVSRPAAISTFTLTNYLFEYIPLPVTITVTNPVGLTEDATCEVSFTETTAFDTPYTFATTSCLMPTEIEGTFVEKLTSTTFTDGDQTSSFVITNVYVPTYSAIESILTVTDFIDRTGDATCEIQFTTEVENEDTLSFPTTSCAMPPDITGTFGPVLTTVSIRNGDDYYRFTLTNMISPTIDAIETTVSVTDPINRTGYASCEISVTTKFVDNTSVTVATTSCDMPEDFSGTFIDETSTTTFIDGTITTILTVTNVLNPQYSNVPTYLVITNPTGQTASASCAINLTQEIVEAITVAIPTTTCEMPDEIDGFFVDGSTTIVFSDGDITTTLTATNVNIPQYEAIVTTLTFTNPTGDAEVGTCEINLTTASAAGTTIALPTTSCNMPNEQDLEFVARTSTTAFSYDGSTITITITNTALPSFPTVETVITVTDPTGYTEAAICEIAFTEIDVSQSINLIATTSCTMPDDIQGAFSAATSSTIVTNGDFTTTVTLTNVIEPHYIAVTTTMVVVDPTGFTGEAVCDIDITSVEVADTTVLVPTTSCQMPSDVTGSFELTTSTTSVSGSTIIVTNTNLPTFSPISTLFTAVDPTGNTVEATCAIQIAVSLSTVIVATTSCTLPSDVAGSFAAQVSTTVLSVDNIETTVTFTNFIVANFAAVDYTMTVTDFVGNINEVTCEVAFTSVSVGVSTVSIPTTSCAMPETLPGTFNTVTSTTVVVDGTKSSTLTVTNINVPVFTAGEYLTTVTNPVGDVIIASCAINLIDVSLTGLITQLPTASCEMPNDVNGSFIEVVSTVTFTSNDDTFTYAVTQIVAPIFSPAVSTMTVTDINLGEVAATCEIDFTSVTLEIYTASIPTTSCNMPEGVDGTFVTAVSTTVVVEGTITSTIEVTNINEPSMAGLQVYTTTITNTQGDTIEAICLVGSTSIPVLQTTVHVPTTSCSMPENVEGTFADQVSTTVYSKGDYTTTLTVTNAILAEGWERKMSTITMTTTIANVVCAYTSTTATSTISDATVVELVVYATPSSTCAITTRTAENSVCSLLTTTSLITTEVDGTLSTAYEKVVLTPAAECHLIYTHEPAEDCEEHTYTRFIGTTDTAGGYINATLVVIETPVSSLCVLPTGGSTLPPISIPSVSLSSSSTTSKKTTTPPSTNVPGTEHGLPNGNPLTSTITSTKLATVTSCSDHNCNGDEHNPNINGDSGNRGHTTGEGDTATKDKSKETTGTSRPDAHAPEPTGKAPKPSEGDVADEGRTHVMPKPTGEPTVSGGTNPGGAISGGAPSPSSSTTTTATTDQPIFEYPVGAGSHLVLKDNCVFALVAIFALLI